MKKTALALCLLFVIMAIIPLMQLANSETATTKPSVPEFIVKYVDNSYDVPPTTFSSTDPYTGKITTTPIPGRHVENKTIEVTIKNQPFSVTLDGKASKLYYNIRIKGHFGEGWTEKYSYSSDALPIQSNSEYTLVSFPAYYPSDSEVDFQVEAILGYYYISYLPDHVFPIPDPENSGFRYESSGWSETQTLTISASPSPEPQQIEPFPTAFVIAVFGTAVALIGAGLLVHFKKRKR